MKYAPRCYIDKQDKIVLTFVPNQSERPKCNGLNIIYEMVVGMGLGFSIVRLGLVFFHFPMLPTTLLSTGANVPHKSIC